MKTENNLLAALRAAVKDAITANRKQAGITWEPPADLIENVCDDVMSVFSKKLGFDGTRFSPERINSFMQQSVNEVCNLLELA